MLKTYYCESAQLKTFYNLLIKSFRVFSPAPKESVKGEKDYYYRLASGEEELVFNPYRVVEPLKSFFTAPLEKVTDYFTPQEDASRINERTIIFGVKSCDLHGHKIQDYVFLEGVEVDSLYALRRENTILISSDCTDYKQVCHCLAWSVMPYPTEGFDLNLSPLNDGFLVDLGSSKGEELIEKYKEFFMLAKDSQIAARKVKRQNLVECLKRHLLPQGLVAQDKAQEVVRSGFSSETWKKFMLTCVECGGCNLICDTCHCFLLGDAKAGNINKKLRVWDSCLYANYARVAGGANPLKTRAQRLRNRFIKKFDFFVDNMGIPACCGCGRCIEVCPGKIDIREVLKDLAKK